MRGRSPQLDLLRGIAVLAVLLVHYPYFKVFEVGWAGVDLFFVLSGFLISGLLFTDWKQNQSISLSRFFIRRGFKIYPAFYFFLFTLLPAVIFQAAHAKHDMGTRALAEIFFLQNYFPHLWLHTWSLAVEEQFYIVLPILLMVLSKLLGGRKSVPFAIIPAIAVLLLIVCLALRLAAVHPSWRLAPRFAVNNFGGDAVTGDVVPLTPLQFRADALFAGVMLGYLFHFRPEFFHRVSRWWLLPLALMLLVPLMSVSTLPNLPYVLTCNTLAFGLLLWWIIPRKQVRAPWIEWVGVYSYSIYLWHLAFVSFFQPLQTRFVWLLLYLAVSIGFGAYMSNIVEMRALAFRDKYFPAKRSSRATPSPEHQSVGTVEA